MLGLTRGPITLIAAGAAGFLVWIGTQVNDESNAAYWEVYGLIAAAGLLMALSQVAGGWTKWGWPTLSPGVVLFAFVPALVCVLWLTIAGQPDSNWFRSHVTAWSSDIGIGGLVQDLLEYLAVFVFGLGLVAGLTVETTPSAAAEPAVTPQPERQVEREQPAAPVTNGQRQAERVPSR
jgi:hypothetical protein